MPGHWDQKNKGRESRTRFSQSPKPRGAARRSSSGMVLRPLTAVRDISSTHPGRYPPTLAGQGHEKPPACRGMGRPVPRQGLW